MFLTFVFSFWSLTICNLFIAKKFLYNSYHEKTNFIRSFSSIIFVIILYFSLRDKSNYS